MCIVATVCIVCADTNLNNISVTHIALAVRYIAARLVVSDKISFCICTEAMQTIYEFVFCVLLNSAWC